MEKGKKPVIPPAAPLTPPVKPLGGPPPEGEQTPPAVKPSAGTAIPTETVDAAVQETLAAAPGVNEEAVSHVITSENTEKPSSGIGSAKGGRPKGYRPETSK